MSARERLEQYLDQVRRRLRTVVFARAAAVAAVVALVVTVLAVWALQSSAFASQAVLAGRFLLVLALGAVAGLLLWRPLRRLHTKRGANELERHLPAQQGRIETYLELARRREQGEDAPLIDLLAEDSLAIASSSPSREVVPPARTWIPTGVGAAAVTVLALLIAFGGAYWGFGSRHLWFGTRLPVEPQVARHITVSPGDVTLRRNQDLPISAALAGVIADAALVHVRFGDAQQWETAPMRVGSDGTFEFTLYALREPLHYYVSAGGARSAEHSVEVVDLPRIERMRLTYVYPEWTGLESETDESSRDIRAVAGTKVELEVHTTAPLDSPTLVVNGTPTSLSSEGARTTGTIVLKKPGQYRISARVGNELVALTDEHEIALVEDEEPRIEIVKPGRDWHATRIEEVPVRVHAADDFRVQGVELHYAVNGGEWQVTKLDGRAKELDTETVLRLEELGAAEVLVAPDASGSAPAESADVLSAIRASNPGLVPGDLVTYYAIARDRKQSAQTDLFLVQVQPFDRRFSQGQAAGGQGGGAGEQQNAISERQREILLATWNLQRSKDNPGARGAERFEDNARMLAELQATLGEQARTLVERTRARLLVNADEQIRTFVEHLEKAAEAMQPAASHLNRLELAEAIPSEQKALQHLLRAEALFTDIQVAFQQGGGSGGGFQAGRDLAEMFELEMDLEKNQYETESQLASETGPQQLEDTVRKLRELAQRQERLARDAANNRAGTPEEQRWKQEQLRREAEELRRRLEQLAQNQRSQGSQSSQSSQGQQGSSGQQSARGQGGRSSASSAAEALNQVEQALENMRSAANSGEGEQPRQANTRSAQEASHSLQRALEQIERGRREGLAGTFDDFAERAGQMLDEQRSSEAELQSAVAQGRESAAPGAPRSAGLDSEQAQALAERKRTLQQQLQSLERDMRAAVRKYRREAPDATDRLSKAASELSESNAGARLGRSALELEYGRTLEAATREGLITEALEALDRELGQAAQLAATEAQRSRENAGEAGTTEELLAELAELRRAWQQAQLANAGAQSQRGNAGAQGDRNAGDGNEGQRSEGQGGSQSQGQSAGTTAGGPGGEFGLGASGALQDGHPSHLIEGARGRLNAWNPPLAEDAWRAAAQSPEFQRQAEAIAQRLRELQRELPRGTLPSTEISALKELADRLRRSGGDPMESQYTRMLDLVDQIELAALKASGRGEATESPTRATAPAPESPRYRENVAEYYRRLGGAPPGAR